VEAIGIHGEYSALERGRDLKVKRSGAVICVPFWRASVARLRTNGHAVSTNPSAAMPLERLAAKNDIRARVTGIRSIMRKRIKAKGIRLELE
jgi:hypothetical protein